MTPSQMLDRLMARFDRVNAYFIEKVASQVKKIGKLSQSSINRMVIMAEMNENIAAINAELAKALQYSMGDLYGLYNEALNNVYTDKRFARALQQNPLPQETIRRMEHYAEAVSRQTAGTMVNLSNTTAIYKPYANTVDEAILAVSSGLTDYKAATRRAIRELGTNGMQVVYDSGYHRRLDTALRQNIVDGTNQIAQNGSIMMGEALGYDAYEISAHARSAPDHEPIQGHVFLKEEFEKMQSEQPFRDIDGRNYKAVRRAIGEWNCMHIAMSFSTKYSTRKYTNEQLDKWAEDNEKGCMIHGKHYTMYEATQLMREIETASRRQKEVANAARAAGDDDLRWECQQKINDLARRYNEIVDASGLTPHRDRMRVEGFRMMKAKK